MQREEKILKLIDRRGLGLEIGPSFNPVASRSEGFNVRTLDHLSREGLIEKYTPDPSVDTSLIEDVDYVWNGEPYSELIGESGCFDWIIASHVIEHSTDLIGFLRECSELLNDTGVLSLVVPDKRVCFDRFRPISSIAQVIDAHEEERPFHSSGRVLDFLLYAVAKDGVGSWAPGESHLGEYDFSHAPELAKSLFEEARKDSGRFFDVHAWCFTPSSFRLIVTDLDFLGLTDLKELAFFDTTGCEFYISLGKQGAGTHLDRMELLKMIELELANP